MSPLPLPHLSSLRFSLLFMMAFLLISSSLSASASESPSPSSEPEIEGASESVASLSILVLVAALFISFLLGYLIELYHFRFLHEAGAAMLLGTAIGAVVRYTTTPAALKSILSFDQDEFMLFLLPPIIFESGYNMKRGHFFYNMGSIMLFAFIGTIISTFTVGGLVYLVSGVLHWSGGSPFTVADSMMFGALISATDPVTVLSIFSALGVEKNLYANVFGESVLNDAVAIVLYRTMKKFVNEPFNTATVGWVSLEFVGVFLGSLVIGVALALMISLLFKHSSMYRSAKLEIILIILSAFVSYLLAEGLKLSGIVAILFCGITMKHYMYPNLSVKGQGVSTMTFQVMAGVCEMVVFVYLGLALFNFESQEEYEWGLIVFSMPILLLARAAHIFPLSALINCCRPASHKIEMNQQVIMWFSGLRGAIAFTLSLDVPTPAESPIFTTTLVIVFISVLIFGGALIPLMKFLNIKTKENQSPLDVSEGGTHEVLDETESAFSESNMFLKFDRSYLKPLFTVLRHRREPAQGGMLLEDNFLHSDELPSDESSSSSDLRTLTGSRSRSRGDGDAEGAFLFEEDGESKGNGKGGEVRQRVAAPSSVVFHDSSSSSSEL